MGRPAPWAGPRGGDAPRTEGPPGIPANVGTQVADMIGLDALGSHPAAPGFTLTAQHG